MEREKKNSEKNGQTPRRQCLQSFAKQCYNYRDLGRKLMLSQHVM
jgi:hypothetical protein